MPQEDKGTIAQQLAKAGFEKSANSTSNQGSEETRRNSAQNIQRTLRFSRDELQAAITGKVTESKQLLVESVLELLRYIAIGQTSINLTASIEAVLKTVDGLDQAALDLLAGAEAQVKELAAELEQQLAVKTNTQSALTLAEIDAELKRREETRNMVTQIQERYENERDEIRGQITTMDQLLNYGGYDSETATRAEKRSLEDKLDALTRTIASIVEAVAEQDQKVGVLLSYRNAVELVEKGLPSGIIGEKLFDFKKTPQ